MPTGLLWNLNKYYTFLIKTFLHSIYTHLLSLLWRLIKKYLLSPLHDWSLCQHTQGQPRRVLNMERRTEPRTLSWCLRTAWRYVRGTNQKYLNWSKKCLPSQSRPTSPTWSRSNRACSMALPNGRRRSASQVRPWVTHRWSWREPARNNNHKNVWTCQYMSHRPRDVFTHSQNDKLNLRRRLSVQSCVPRVCKPRTKQARVTHTSLSRWERPKREQRPSTETSTQSGRRHLICE